MDSALSPCDWAKADGWRRRENGSARGSGGLERAYEFCRDATLIRITRHVGETLDFDRVLVMNRGRLVEDAGEVELASRRDSLYRAPLNDEEVVVSDEAERLLIEAGTPRASCKSVYGSIPRVAKD